MPLQLKLKEGDPAPNFQAETADGKTVSLAQFRGQNVVLYFYPRDDTPGCTKEACAFRDQFGLFQNKNVQVLGVSTDSAESHRKFIEKYQLPFPLLIDQDKKLVRAYGVYGTKSFLGRTYQGTHRVTFLIGPDGLIRKIWPKVKPADHAQEVLDALGNATAVG